MAMKKEMKMKNEGTELEELLPAGNVKIYLNFYYAIHKTQQTPSQYPKKELRDLRRGLKKIGLTNEELNQIDKEILLKCLLNPKACRAQAGALLRMRKDFAKDFLIHALVFDLKLKTKKPKYELVTAFLHSHKVSSKIQGSEDIRKRYKRVSFEDVVENFGLFLMINPSSFQKILKVTSGIFPGFLTECRKKLVSSSIFHEYLNFPKPSKRT